MAAVCLVARVEPEVSIAFKAVVQLGPGCDGCQGWAWDVTERMDEAIVEDVRDGLQTSVSFRVIRRNSMRGDGGELGNVERRKK